MLRLLADRAVAAGLAARWWRFKDPKTGDLEGPHNLRIDLPSGRRTRDVNIDETGQAEALARFPFERWIALGDYQAILDPDARVIVAEVYLSGHVSLHRLPGATVEPLEDDESARNRTADSVRAGFTSGSEWPDRSSRLIVPAPSGELSLELYTHRPPEICALTGRRSIGGYGLIIRGVTAARHDEALELLLDLSTSFFLDLDVGYGLTGRLAKAPGASLVTEDGYDFDKPNTAPPRFPSTRHNKDAASLYLYARSQALTPLLQYLVYYQVIEFYLPTYTRSATMNRLRNILKDPRFSHSDDVALGRLLDAVAPSSKRSMSEREQVTITIAHCVDDIALTTFLSERPAASKALSDKTRITGVRVINVRDQQTSLTQQVADRIYDLRCRIVHSKDSADETMRPLRPFERESRLMRHDLSLIRFIAQHVLIASSRPASWT